MNTPNQKITIWPEHIRQRPGMYLGDLRFTGFKQLLEYLFEEILKYCRESPVLEIEFPEANRFIIVVHNANIAKFISRIKNLENSSTLPGALGLQVFIATGSEVSIAVNEGTSLVVLNSQKGRIEIAASSSTNKERTVRMEYSLDKEIFKDFLPDYDLTNEFLRQFAYLNPFLKIISTDKTTAEEQRNIYHFPAGVFKQLDRIIAGFPYTRPSIRVNIEATVNRFSYKIGIAYPNAGPDKPIIKTYAGNIETFLGGSFNDGILDGLITAVKDHAKKENTEILISRKLALNKFVIVAAVTGEDFTFTGSTKRKLGMPKLRKDVKQLVAKDMAAYFEADPAAARVIINVFGG